MKNNLPPAVPGTMARRILINFRVDPSVLEHHLPEPFRPKRINGFGVAGISLIRLEPMRPRLAPGPIGGTSDCTAHQIAVEWDEGPETREGVYIPIRHTDSRDNPSLAGRQFPRGTRHAGFWSAETSGRIKVEVWAGHPRPLVRVAARIAQDVSRTSLFHSTDLAAEFFRCGSVGWSSGIVEGTYEGVQLIADDWSLQPLAVEHCMAAWFDNPDRFPPGSIAFDSAFLTRNIAHEWRALPPLRTRGKEAA